MSEVVERPVADNLTGAIEAGKRAARIAHPTHDQEVLARTYAVAVTAVHAAAPIIERAVREAIVARIEAEVVTGAVVPEWARAGMRPTAAGVRRWVIGIIRGEGISDGP